MFQALTFLSFYKCSAIQDATLHLHTENYAISAENWLCFLLSNTPFGY